MTNQSLFDYNVLSLFDGISCGQIALQRAGIRVDNYFASEIKQSAIKCTMDNFPDTKQVGDVRLVSGLILPKIDLLIGGSPCKGISRINKNQEGLSHNESILFWEYVRLLNETKPKYFLLENTHGNKEAICKISEVLGVKPISINSKLVSAQNRPRYYWTNIPSVSQPDDKNIIINDILDYSGDVISESRLKWLLSESGKNSIKKGYTKINPYPKSGCITANGHKKWNENYLFKDGVYRYLSQRELERLQTLPEGYTKCLTYSEAYDCIGDGWTVDVISHILSFIKQAKQMITSRHRQLLKDAYQEIENQKHNNKQNHESMASVKLPTHYHSKFYKKLYQYSDEMPTPQSLPFDFLQVGSFVMYAKIIYNKVRIESIYVKIESLEFLGYQFEGELNPTFPDCIANENPQPIFLVEHSILYNLSEFKTVSYNPYERKRVHRSTVIRNQYKKGLSKQELNLLIEKYSI
jgi:DNA (cytosine-5)-methyltransferase 3A